MENLNPNNMNLVDHYVTEVLSEPRFEFGKWWVKVKGIGYSGESESNLMFDSKKEALSVCIGYEFLA